MQITPGDFTDSRVVDLLHYHLTTARAQTAPGSAHALDLSGLQSPDIAFWTAWHGEALVAVGALKQLSRDHGEVKSMHTVPTARRKGVGGAMLQHIIAFARSRGILRLSLETGSWDYFQPAVALYRRYGFVECPPFADYVPDPNSIFMTLDLRKQDAPARRGNFSWRELPGESRKARHGRPAAGHRKRAWESARGPAPRRWWDHLE